jgi:hypothetical protein
MTCNRLESADCKKIKEECKGIPRRAESLAGWVFWTNAGLKVQGSKFKVVSHGSGYKCYWLFVISY